MKNITHKLIVTLPDEAEYVIEVKGRRPTHDRRDQCHPSDTDWSGRRFLRAVKGGRGRDAGYGSYGRYPDPLLMVDEDGEDLPMRAGRKTKRDTARKEATRRARHHAEWRVIGMSRTEAIHWSLANWKLFVK